MSLPMHSPLLRYSPSLGSQAVHVATPVLNSTPVQVLQVLGQPEIRKDRVTSYASLSKT